MTEFCQLTIDEKENRRLPIIVGRVDRGGSPGHGHNWNWTRFETFLHYKFLDSLNSEGSRASLFKKPFSKYLIWSHPYLSCHLSSKQTYVYAVPAVPVSQPASQSVSQPATCFMTGRSEKAKKGIKTRLVRTNMTAVRRHKTAHPCLGPHPKHNNLRRSILFFLHVKFMEYDSMPSYVVRICGVPVTEEHPYFRESRTKLQRTYLRVSRTKTPFTYGTSSRLEKKSRDR